MKPIPTCKCGKPAMHTTYWPQKVVRDYQCCECYVKSGAAPADWHPACMETWRNLRQEKAADCQGDEEDIGPPALAAALAAATDPLSFITFKKGGAE